MAKKFSLAFLVSFLSLSGAVAIAEESAEKCSWDEYTAYENFELFTNNERAAEIANTNAIRCFRKIKGASGASRLHLLKPQCAHLAQEMAASFAQMRAAEDVAVGATQPGERLSLMNKSPIQFDVAEEARAPYRAAQDEIRAEWSACVSTEI